MRSTLLVTHANNSNQLSIQKDYYLSIQKHCWEEKPDVGDDLSVFLLKLLPEVGTLPDLVTISIIKVKISVFQNIMWSHVGHVIKESFIVSHHPTKFDADKNCVNGDGCVVCHVILQNEVITGSINCMRDSPS